jgi:hypothetical protein
MEAKHTKQNLWLNYLDEENKKYFGIDDSESEEDLEGGFE